MKPDDSKNHPAVARGALESAVAAVERSLRADGSLAGGIPEGERAGFEWRALFRWAEQGGFVFPAEVEPERKGGREHDVTHVPSEGRWTKFTKPDACGLTVEMVDGAPILLPASPLQYLRRIAAQNAFWGDDTRLLGVQVRTPGARIVTSQPDVAGEPVPWELLHAYLCDEPGFRRLDIPPMGYYKSASYLRGDVAMFDVHPANFVLTPPGAIVPIDVIMIRFTGAELEALQTKVETIPAV
jgi:hypothetical protein